MEENKSWLQTEIDSLNIGKPNAENYPESLKLIENKIVEVEIDFSKPFEKKPNKLNSGVIQALIPTRVGDTKKTFWLNVKNPLYGELCQLGKAGKTKFKILRTGKQKESRYTIVE